MAPISPDSLKRSSASQSSDDDTEQPTRKRVRLDTGEGSDQMEQESKETEHLQVQSSPILPQTPPPETTDIPPKINRDPFFNDDPQVLLERSVALVLQHIGFDGADSDALNALCSEVDAYASHFIAKITTAMLSQRRPLAIPCDFEYALYHFDLPLASLEPHLRPPVPAIKSQIQLEPSPMLPPDELIRASKPITALLGDDLSGNFDKAARPYIPKKFAPFPSKHTYKRTTPEETRVKDKRMIREEFAKLAKTEEELLRKFDKECKKGQADSLRKAADKDPHTKQKHEQWVAIIDEFSQKKGTAASEKDSYEDRSMIVNAESRYFRKGVPIRKKRAVLPDLGLGQPDSSKTGGI